MKCIVRGTFAVKFLLIANFDWRRRPMSRYARPRESIYQLIYSVIIRSAWLRGAMGDGKDNHVNEIPNVSIVANAAWEYRDRRIESLLQSTFHKFWIHVCTRLFWTVYPVDANTDSTQDAIRWFIWSICSGKTENSRKRDERQPQNDAATARQTISKRLPLRRTPPNFLHER